MRQNFPLAIDSSRLLINFYGEEKKIELLRHRYVMWLLLLDQVQRVFLLFDSLLLYVFPPHMFRLRSLQFKISGSITLSLRTVCNINSYPGTRKSTADNTTHLAAGRDPYLCSACVTNDPKSIMRVPKLPLRP